MFLLKNRTILRLFEYSRTNYGIWNTRKYHDLKKIRNIGLVAHIDAGKTTTSERILFYSGRTDQMGEVHHGDTVMDWMDQERERGITITSASATVQWKGHSINLIDTPGHVDFGFEVERSLSALDGAIVILDGSAGVQAQTIKVWQQADRHKLPRLFFINKMDKPRANLDSCLDSIRKKLEVNPILLQVSLFNSKNIFSGLIDISTGIAYSWPENFNESEHGKFFLLQNLLHNSDEFEPFLSEDETSRYHDIILSQREELIGQLCDLDEEFSEYVLQHDKLEDISSKQISKALQNITIKQLAFPTLIGSAFKKIGIQQLLDSVLKFLPNPAQSPRATSVFELYNQRTLSEHSSSQEDSKICGYVFKNAFDKHLGSLSYVRLYSGTLQPGQMIYNLNRECSEKMIKIYKPFSNHFQDVTTSMDPSMALGLPKVGDICVISGLNHSRTGDTLVSPSDFKNLQYTNDSLLVSVTAPDPVFYCSLEPPSLSKMKALEGALDNLQREDPSISVQFDKNTNQIILKGMGELHIDVIKDRIKREYGINVTSGPLQVSYLESVNSSGFHLMDISKVIGSVNNTAKIGLEIRPSTNGVLVDAKTIKKHNFRIVNTRENNLASQIKPLHLKWIQKGVQHALEYGPMSAFPVVNVEVLLHDFVTSSKTSEAFIISIVSQCIFEALKKGSPIMLEPIMKLEIFTPDQYLGPIMSDLSNRRAEIGESISNLSSDNMIQTVLIPLDELNNYSTVLRTISSGMASFEMSLHSYRTLDEKQAQRAMDNLSGVLY